jgi:hypothetical protein
MARLGDVSPGWGMPELKAMISAVLSHMEMSNTGFTHDRRPSVNVGYRVWNPERPPMVSMIKTHKVLRSRH